MRTRLTATLLASFLLPIPATADISDEANACIDTLRERLGNVGGEVVGQMGSQAGTLVTLRTADGTEWECIVWDGPEVAELRAVSGVNAADDGGGAMAGSTPDFWRVEVASALNVHSAPSTASGTFFQLPNGSIVRNLGCQASEGRTWCQVPTGPDDGASIGWVAAEFLVPSAAPTGGGNAQITTGGSGATAGGTSVMRVQFTAGSTGAELTDQLMPQASKAYLLGAQEGQDLYFRLAANGPGMQYRIVVPSGSELMPWTDPSLEYRGQLYQTGDHRIEVRNTGNGAQSYNVIFGIE